MGQLQFFLYNVRLQDWETCVYQAKNYFFSNQLSVLFAFTNPLLKKRKLLYSLTKVTVIYWYFPLILFFINFQMRCHKMSRSLKLQQRILLKKIYPCRKFCFINILSGVINPSHIKRFSNTIMFIKIWNNRILIIPTAKNFNDNW